MLDGARGTESSCVRGTRRRGSARAREVLVHCAKGISRSASVAIAWLMREHGWTFAETLDKVEARRKTVYPNVGFQARWRHGEVFTAFRSCRACSWTCGIRV